MLRMSLGMMLVGLAILAFLNPSETMSYVHARYLMFHSHLQIYGTLFAVIPRGLPFTIAVNGLAILMGAAGVVVILNRRTLVYVFAYVLGIIGVILHMPYDRASMVSQIRKLVFVFGIFFCMVISASLPDKLPEKPTEISPIKRKTE